MQKGIGAFVLIFFCVLFIAKNIDSDQTPENFEKKPQEYMKSVSLWQYTSGGLLKHHLKANYWAYLPEQKKSLLHFPEMLYCKTAEEHWIIHSKFAHVFQKSLDQEIEKIALWEAVEIQRKPSKTQESFSLTTTQLNYKPKTQKLSSEAFVTLLKPNLKMTGIGLQGNLKNNEIKLQKQVKTEYLANTSLLEGNL